MNLSRALLFSVTFLAACPPPPPPVPGAMSPTGEVLVVVNGQNVTQDMVDAQLKQLPDDVKMQLERSGGVGRIKDNLIAQELLYQEALKRKVHEKPELGVALALAQRQVMAQAVLNEVGNERLTDAVIQQWYQDHLVQFSRPQVDVSLIVVADEASGKDVVAKAQGGADFAELARTASLDKASGADGGKLGWLSARELREPLGTPVMAANKGDIVGPLETPRGWHVFKVNDKREQIPLEEVKDMIRSQAQREVMQKYIDELEKGANIERKDAAAPTDAAPAGAAPGAPTMPAAPAAPAAPGQGG